jgi:hypothetical protein
MPVFTWELSSLRGSLEQGPTNLKDRRTPTPLQKDYGSRFSTMYSKEAVQNQLITATLLGWIADQTYGFNTFRFQ